MAAASDLVIRLKTQTKQFEAGFKRSQRQVLQLQRRVTALNTRLHATTAAAVRTTKALGLMATVVGALSKAVLALMRALIFVVGPFAAAAAFISAAKSGEMFNRAMQNSIAIMGHVSDAMRRKMTNAALEVARVTKFTAEEVGKAYFYLASAGMNVAQSMEALPAVGRFAQAGMFDLARATELATDAQHALGLASKDPAKNLEKLTRVTDVLVKANTLADATVEQFAEALTQKAGAAFKVVGKEIEEAVAVLAALAMAGRKGEEGGTLLSRIMIGLKANALKNADAFRQLEIAVFDGSGEMRYMWEIVSDLEKKLLHMSDAQQQAAIMALGFTKRNADAVAMLLGHSEAIKQFYDQLGLAGGKTKEVSEKQLTPFQKGWAMLTAEITRNMNELMHWAGPGLQTAMERMSEWVTGVRVVFILLKEGVSSYVKHFIDMMAFGWDTVAGTGWEAWDQMIEQVGAGFGIIGENLDTMLGSWTGLQEGIEHLTTQTTLWVMASWETVTNSFHTNTLHIKGWFIDMWHALGEVGVKKTMPILSRFFMWWQRRQAAMEGRKWTMTPVEERAIAAEDQDRVLGELAQKRKENKIATDKSIEKQEGQHEKNMAAIGKANLDEQERWEKHRKELPTLSKHWSDEWELARRRISGKALPGGEDEPGGKVGGMGGLAAPPKLTSAMERGSSQAWSVIANAMGQQKKPQEKMVDEQKKSNRHLQVIETNMTDFNPEGTQIDLID